MTLSAFLFAALFAIAVSKMATPPVRKVEKVSDSALQFVLDTYRQVSDKENIVISPFSLHAVLAMVELGAVGDTSEQLRQAFAIDKGTAIGDYHEGVHKALSTINTPTGNGNVKLLAAQSAFVQQNLALLDTFTQQLRDFYHTQFTSVDFATQAEAARVLINKWVEDHTAGKIPDLLKRGTIQELTRIVLVNALYFKGNWANKFDPAQTEKFDFSNGDGSKSRVDMMFQKSAFSHIGDEQLAIQGIRLPYEGDEVLMMILMPKEGLSLDALQSGLTAAKLKQFARQGRPIKTKVFLPKFKLEFEAEMNDVLMKLGIRDMFSDQKADLSKMTGDRSLHVSAVVHKSVVEVDEKGTEAAAASGAIIAFRSAIVFEPEFVVNRPFIFLIYDRRVDVPLFIGHVKKF